MNICMNYHLLHNYHYYLWFSFYVMESWQVLIWIQIVLLYQENASLLFTIFLLFVLCIFYIFLDHYYQCNKCCSMHQNCKFLLNHNIHILFHMCRDHFDLYFEYNLDIRHFKELQGHLQIWHLCKHFYHFYYILFYHLIHLFI